ncbi:MAG TPA: metallophosphoesterase [Syntrophales bacterium]|nr:metallophosphoesterase [Syntrophales bacterium]HOX93171.1 metallophosphoesterase [Syntrophales bacterium]HPI57650.1 metallophosphoesterase [Syntrophales bacterium]HPN25337.1 metallophosphoesterase [Syntrophales bacterium]HQM29629.1 metallophosphoesterase [Syntrophales bacterium]
MTETKANKFFKGAFRRTRCGRRGPCRTLVFAGFIVLLVVLPVLSSARAEGAAAHATMAVYGDTRGNPDIHRKVIAGIMKFSPRAVFHAGDLVRRGGGPQEWAEFKEIIAPLSGKAEFFPVRGNHDAGSSHYFEAFTLPGNEKWYSVERHGVRFVLLDTNSRLTPGSEQYRWLEAELLRFARKDKFVAVVLHHSPFSTGIFADEKKLQKKIVPLFEKYAVDIVFSGHHHFYERLRVRDVTYIVTGGGGDPLHFQFRHRPDSAVFMNVHHFCIFHVSGDELILAAYDVDLNPIDQHRIRKRK